MAFGKITELFKSNDNNITQRQEVQQVQPKRTELMGSAEGSNVTWIMESGDANAPVQLGKGSTIDGFTITHVLSENTGEATLLVAIKDGYEYVVKLYHKNKTPKPEMINLLSQIESRFVIKAVKNGTFMDRFYEILPYYRNGDLISQMPISEKVLEGIIIPCINEGLKALHDKDIIHRDIKPSNIFFSEKKDYVVIGDFGISSVLNSDVSVRATSMSRTLGYSAPETSNGFISKESDYYSFGITLYHLILGADPFAGMSDMQILYQTINKKLELPQSVPVRLQELITGLTLKDRNDRWGYDEVKRWLAGEHVVIQERVRKTQADKPYTFAKNTYEDLQALSMAFAHDWDNAKKHLYRGLIEKYLTTFDAEMASQCMDLKEISDKDVAVFRLIHLINPNAPLCYKGRLFNDIESIGDAMMASIPEIDQDVYEMVKNGSLTNYLKWNHFSTDLIDAVQRAETGLNGKDDSIQYYKLMYIFKPSMGFEVNSVRCENIEQLIELLENTNQITRENLADSLVNNGLFLAWIASQGYDTQVDKWLEVFGKVEEEK